MSSSYDRVEYSDKAHFSMPSDEHQYSDDPIKNGSKNINGNGVYNDYTVELKPKEYTTSFKLLCFNCKNTKRVKFIMLGAIVVFCFALVLIIISAAAHHRQQGAANTTAKVPAYGLIAYGPDEKGKITSNHLDHKTYMGYSNRLEAGVHGLFAYGPDEKGKITFNHLDHKTYMGYFNRLEAGVHDYSTLMQTANLDKYILCNDNFTSVPEGKVCMQTLQTFGNNCQQFEMYGILEERPCVLLVLKMEKDVIPVPFNFTGVQNMEIHDKLAGRFSDTNVAISCEGKTQTSVDLIGTDSSEGQPIEYYPMLGFPLYYFLSRDTDGYINPAVMIQFNTIPTQHEVTVKCTAWAKNFNMGKPENSEYSTEFTFFLN